MTGEFVREERYIVFKMSDLGNSLKGDEIRRLAREYAEHRQRLRKKPLECVVVEKDWPEYEPPWKAIEARVTGAQPAPNAVAYLDLGAGGYMDIGTDLTDEELDAIPKGRHMLGIVGTYGIDGYFPAQPAPSVPDAFAWPECPKRRQSHVLFDDGYEEGWAACVATIKAALAAPEAKP